MKLVLPFLLLALSLMNGCSTAKVRPENEDPLKTFRTNRNEVLLSPDRVVAPGDHGLCDGLSMTDSNNSMIRRTHVHLDKSQINDIFYYVVSVDCYSTLNQLSLRLTKPALTCKNLASALSLVPLCRKLDTVGGVRELAADIVKYFRVPEPGTSKLLSHDSAKVIHNSMSSVTAYMVSIHSPKEDFHEIKVPESMVLSIGFDQELTFARFYVVSNDEMAAAGMAVPQQMNLPEVAKLGEDIQQMRKVVEEALEATLVRN